MAFTAFPGTCQVELTMTWAGQRVQNVLHYHKLVTFDATTLTGIANAAVTKWNTYIKPRVNVTCSLVEVKATDISTQTGPVAYATTGLPIIGTVAGASLPNNATVAVTKRTAKRGRSYRGRIYHPGLSISDVTGNVVSPGVVTALIAAWTNFLILNDGATNANLVVASRFQSGVQLVTGEVNDVTGFTVESTVDSQRRRLPGRGT